MNAQALEKALGLAADVGHVIVATADAAGTPHVAVAGDLERVGPDRVTVSAWFCPGTMANLDTNPRLSLVVWEPGSDRGWQLVGAVEAVDDLRVLDGFAPGEEADPPLPQVQQLLTIRVDRVLQFSVRPHTDVEP